MGIRKVTDFGRLTVAVKGIVELATGFVKGKASLEKNGYQFILQKNTLNLNIDCTAGGGFRNLYTLVRSTASGMIVEVQWTLSYLEAIKHSSIGHIAYQVMRKSGLTLDTSLSGNLNQAMIDAIVCGQALSIVRARAAGCVCATVV